MPIATISTGRALLQSNPDEWPEYRDNFGTGATPGAGWIGSTGTISGGKLTITPTLSGNLLPADPGLEAAYSSGLCGTLTKGGSPTVAESADVHGGSKAQAFTATALLDRVYWGTVTPTALDWYICSIWGKRTAGANRDARIGAYGAGVSYTTGPAIESAAYAQRTYTFQTASTATINMYAVRSVGAAAGDAVIVDDGDLEKITYSSMFLTREYKSTDLIAGTSFNWDTWVFNSVEYPWYRGGVVVAVDSPTNPQNYVIGYFDGKYFGLNKVIGKVETSLISVTAGAAATNQWENGEILEIRRTGNVFSLWYGGRQLGTNQTVTDISIINNKYVGLYSQTPLVSFNDFDVRTYGTNYRKPDFSAYTPATYTAGQAICTLRFDDNDHDSYDYVLGELTSRSLVGSFVVSRALLYSYATPSYLTLANLLAIQAAGNEIVCHGMTHGADPANFAAFVRETSEAAEEMRRMGITIYTWAQPGTWVAGYNFNSTSLYGKPPDAHLRHYFKAYEAYIGAIPATKWPLPRAAPAPWGSILGHGGADTLAGAEASLDTAITNGTGVEFIWHPILFDGAGWTKSDFEDFLDYVEAAVTDGDVVVMTLTDQLFATEA